MFISLVILTYMHHDVQSRECKISKTLSVTFRDSASNVAVPKSKIYDDTLPSQKQKYGLWKLQQPSVCSCYSIQVTKQERKYLIVTAGSQGNESYMKGPTNGNSAEKQNTKMSKMKAFGVAPLTTLSVGQHCSPLLNVSRNTALLHKDQLIVSNCFICTWS